jgi:hypothetical protein
MKDILDSVRDHGAGLARAACERVAAAPADGMMQGSSFSAEARLRSFSMARIWPTTGTG